MCRGACIYIYIYTHTRFCSHICHYHVDSRDMYRAGAASRFPLRSQPATWRVDQRPLMSQQTPGGPALHLPALLTPAEMGLYRDNGKENGNYYNELSRITGYILGLYRDNGKENGNYSNGLYRV